MVDDLGYGDLSSYGRQEYETPVLDSFVAQGLRFNHAYSGAPICTPTRVALMTGRYPARHIVGLEEPLSSTDTVGLIEGETTLSSLIKAQGYQTALIGKWHLGYLETSHPLRHGYDRFFGITLGAADYIDHKYFADEETFFDDENILERDGYMTDLIGDEAVAYLETIGNQPFFLNLEFTAPHWPWQLPGDDPVNGSTISDFVAGGSVDTLGKMITNLEVNVQKVLKALEDNGLKDNTVIIFTSDNGGERHSFMAGLRGRKGNLLEGGIRVPAAVHWPGVTKPRQVTNQVAVTQDWTVTMLDIAGIPNFSELGMDGISLKDFIKNPETELSREVYWRFGKPESNNGVQVALRDGNFKYLKFNDEEYLYDLEKDSEESNDIKESNSIVFEKLKNRAEELTAEMLPLPDKEMETEE